ncbi:stage III sporulation protein AF [Clostridium isatidis]|uniref:Stage III sporulation protein AF n=1 Tax=Clostridium isatidis TaxID=182773 RepID=A0A343JAX6_9CLOT|nr:stage III sporulation protein AF [Clostridium isatidis]ASW42684.1 stage III sporulation protein AF [Clostridium isatidis]NLZ33619.1 stage III sporulation protein AF [Clostridiales bacterium]
MELIKDYVITLATMIILISAIELIAPDNSMKKYLKFVLGLILIAVMISPIIDIFSNSENIIVSNIAEYFELDKEDDKSIEVSSNKEYSSSTLEMFKENLEKNCNRLLNEKFVNQDFESNIICNIDPKNIEYSIEKIKVGVKEKGTSKIDKVIISTKEEKKSEKEVNNKDEIVSYLMEIFAVTKDKIEIYKINE